MRPAPWLVVVGGPNGSGKSTLLGTGFVDRIVATQGGHLPIEVLDPDRIAAELKRNGHTSPDFRGMAIVHERLQSAITNRTSVAVETVVLAHAHLRLLNAAKSEGFRTLFVYVFLRLPEMNVERVATRAEMGGHTVDPDIIRARRVRSLIRFPAFAEAAEMAVIIDNSADGLSEHDGGLVAEKSEAGAWTLYTELDGAPDPIADYLRVQAE